MRARSDGTVIGSRRAALGALAAFGLASGGLAGCGVSRKVVRIAELAHGCVDVPVPPADGVHIERGAFLSAHVPDAVRYAILIPDGAKPDAVVYLLPGRGSDVNAALSVGWAGFLAQQMRRGGHRFALAIADAGETYFHPRASGENRLATVTTELPRIVGDVLGRAPAQEAIMGQSMGGYGALLAAEREPRRFRAVAVAGPAIFPSYEDERRSVGDAFDSAADFAKYDVVAGAHALRGRPVMIAVGQRDPFVPGVRMFAKALPSARIVEQPGCHDDGFWRASAASLLAFVAAHL